MTDDKYSLCSSKSSNSALSSSSLASSFGSTIATRISVIVSVVALPYRYDVLQYGPVALRGAICCIVSIAPTSYTSGSNINGCSSLPITCCILLFSSSVVIIAIITITSATDSICGDISSFFTSNPFLLPSPEPVEAAIRLRPAAILIFL